jgi:predicted DNA-binding WGR domain protein
MTRQLVYMDSHSSKFWNIALQGNTFTVTFGRIGTDGQTQTKAFASGEMALKEAEKLIREKLGKGYVDSAGSGVSATSAHGSDDGLIPSLAFSSILRREDISENATTFIGRRVVDFDPEKPFRSDVVYRFRSDWENDELIPHLEQFLADPKAPETTALVIGSWHGDDSETTPKEVIKLLVQSKARLPKLAAIYVGDITSEENEMSWIHQCDLSPLLEAFPSLQFLRSRGGDGLAIDVPEHENLRALILETGGLDATVLKSIALSSFPNLEHLELWLGTDEYGGEHSLDDLQPILDGGLFPKLRYLGLRNSQMADEIAAAIVRSPLIQRIETLDLSLGVLTDEGARALLKLPASPTLRKLNLHYNYISSDLARQLKALPLTVDVSRPSDLDEADEEDRFVAVGE